MDVKELSAWEGKCTQDEAPHCAAACPLHVDVRGVCGHLARRQWDKAWAVLARTLPLPGLAARLCDAPCRAACLRRDLGGAVALGELERFCAAVARPVAPPRPLPSRRFPVTVLGGGIAGLGAAWELARRGFDVRLYRLAWAVDWGSLVASAVFEAELDNLERLGVVIESVPALEPGLPDVLLAEARAVFVDTEGLPAELTACLAADRLTLATERPGLFANRPDETSFAQRLAVGRRLATSVERFMQGIALTTARDKEGPYRSRLVTDLSTVRPAPALDLGAGGDADAVCAEAGRCLQCQCLTCVAHCAMLEHYKSYPKAYARQIYNNSSNVVGIRQANTMINSCMLCGLCETVCPDGFSMAAVCLDARRVMVGQGRMPPSAHEFALRELAFAGGDRCTLARHAPDAMESDYLFFPGCQLAASAPEAVEAAYADLRERLGRTGLLLGCCGAPARWAGREDLLAGTMADLRSQWETLGRPKLVVACPTCLKTLAEALPEAPRIAYWSVLRAIGLPRDAAGLAGRRLAINDPCAARHDVGLRRDVRALLRALEVTAVEPEASGERAACCGYGGLLAEANPELAASVGKRLAGGFTDDAVTYCAMCRDMLAKAGARALHLLDLLFPSGDDPAARPAPDATARRENRARLRDGLLARLWREPVGLVREDYEAVAVTFSEEAARLMDARRILKSDVQKVLLAARETGRRFVHGQTGRFLACLRPAVVTYWVEYEMRDETYLVHRAWCHRLRILGDRT